MSGRERTRRGFLGASIATGIGAAMRSSLPSRPPWRAASTTARPDDRARPVHAARAPGSVIKACTVYDKPWWRDKGLSGSSVSIDRLVSATFDNSAEDALADRDRDQARVANTRALHDAASPRRCRQCGPGVTRRQSPTESTTPTATQRRGRYPFPKTALASTRTRRPNPSHRRSHPRSAGRHPHRPRAGPRARARRRAGRRRRRVGCRRPPARAAVHDRGGGTGRLRRPGGHPRSPARSPRSTSARPAPADHWTRPCSSCSTRWPTSPRCPASTRWPRPRPAKESSW